MSLPIVTFWTYTGQVSTHVCDFVNALCMRGRTVVVVDFNFTAPLLHTRFGFPALADPSEGLVGYLQAYLHSGQAPESLKPYLVKIESQSSGRAWLLPTGSCNEVSNTFLWDGDWSELCDFRDNAAEKIQFWVNDFRGALGAVADVAVIDAGSGQTLSWSLNLMLLAKIAAAWTTPLEETPGNTLLARWQRNYTQRRHDVQETMPGIALPPLTIFSGTEWSLSDAVSGFI